MLIRNRVISLIYRTLELALCIFTLTVLVIADKTETSPIESFSYYGAQCLLFTSIIVLLEVIFNIVDLIKNGKNGIAAYVYMPLTLAVLTFLLVDALIYNISAPFLGGYADGEALTSALCAHIFLPIVFFFDYFLFSEKGTVRWSHALYWMIYPLSYLIIIISAHYFWNNTFYPYPFLNHERFIDPSSPEILSGNFGWNGVLIVLGAITLGFLLISFLVIFLNNVLAGKYKKR